MLPEKPDTSAGRRTPPWSVHTWLAWLVLACLLPGMVGAGLLFIHEYQNGRARLEQNILLAARALEQAVDNQLFRAMAVAEALSTSHYLASGDFASFHAQAREVLALVEPGVNFILIDQNAQQIVNTLKEAGDSLPSSSTPEVIRRVFATRQPVISDLFTSQLLHRSFVTVNVPVVIKGEVTYVLSMGIRPEDFGAILKAQGLPPDWVAAVFDSTGTFVALTHSQERLVGQKAADDFIAHITAVPEGSVENTTREGLRVLSIYSRSAATQWAVGIGIPRHNIEMTVLRSLSLVTAGVLALFAIGIGLARYMGQRIALSTKALTVPAMALGAGQSAPIPEVHTKEAAEVAWALGCAADMLNERTRALEKSMAERRAAQAEVEESHARLELLNAELENRVRERTAELERSNDALLRSNMELQRFAHAAAHDLQTPLRSIAGFSQLLQQELGESVDARTGQWLTLVVDSTRRLQTLIQELLAYTRLDAQAHPFEATDLRQICGQVAATLAAFIAEKGAEIGCGNLPTLMADRIQMAQLLQNLIENGIKYNKSQPPRVSVKCERRGEEWVFAVVDNGIGIDPKHHRRIFEIFRRLHTYDDIPGTGIGLAICHRIVERHGGRIWVESMPGEGSAFYFSLPDRPG